MQNRLLIFIFITLFAGCYTASGQKDINSPYSRFNIGSLENQGSFRSLGMGGVGMAMNSSSSIYYLNPASYSSLDTNSFVFDFGLDFGRNYISDASSKFSSSDLNFHHLIIGFPIARGWGFSAGIVPVSSGYYKIADQVTSTSPDYDPIVGAYTIDHIGVGGITKFYFGTGAEVIKNLSIGANMSFLTGQLTRTNQFIFEDYTTVFNNLSVESLELHGINFDLGMQYTLPLKKNYFLTFGASISTASNYNSKYNQLSERFTAYAASDTVSYTYNNYGKTYLPDVLRFGISFGKKNKFIAGLDYTTTKWSASKIPGPSGYAADTKAILFGAEFIPNKFSNYSLIDRIAYRIGGHVEDNYLIINGEQIKEYGASAGLGIPLGHTTSVANIYVDFTHKSGSQANSLHNEDVLSIGLSLNLYDFWFLKRKYD